jgi:hypothetical protein
VVDPKDMTVSLRSIEIARFDQVRAVVASGVEAGDVVVTAGVQALRPGQKVRFLGTEAGSGTGGGFEAGS